MVCGVCFGALNVGWVCLYSVAGWLMDWLWWIFCLFVFCRLALLLRAGVLLVGDFGLF